MPPAFQAAVRSPHPGARGCVRSVGTWVSPLRLYGDESELHFWTVAAHYLHSLCWETPASAPATTETAPRDHRVTNPLDICYDVLCENAYFQVGHFMEFKAVVLIT